GGHAVTPISVQDIDANHARIVIYDNNFPSEDRYIEVNLEANTWRYSTAANPREGVNDYEGDAETQSLDLTPDSARLGTHHADFLEDAPFSEDQGLEEPTEDTYAVGDEVSDDDETSEAADQSGSRGSAASQQHVRPAMHSTPAERQHIGKEKYTMEISLAGRGAHLLITSPDGKRLGYDHGKLVNEIPGASLIRLKMAPGSRREEREPANLVPGGVDYLVIATGTTDN